RFERVNEALIAEVEECSEARWRATTAEEGWPVGVTAHHVAGMHRAVADLIRLVAEGGSLPPITPEQADLRNASHAEQHTGRTRGETAEPLRDNVAYAAAFVRGLDDEQLDRATPPHNFVTGSVAQLIEGFLIGHTQAHLASIQATSPVRASAT